ncbi:protein F41H10.5 [Aphelenchoides avenae]|nr:protein F41H10.5 [Aphelenchus avenae]
MQRQRMDEKLNDVSLDFVDSKGQNATTGAEFRLPPISDALQPELVLPFLAYLIAFQLIGVLLKRYAWKSYSGFRQYRLRNLSVCLLHSTLIGIWTLAFFLTHPHEMFNDTMHWYSTLASQLLLVSMGYFVHDTIDMLKYEVSRWTFELLLHHVATIFVLESSLLAKKFILYAYWALLMEVNSIFLHARTISQLSGLAARRPKLFFAIRWVNIATFIVFRFLVQAWQLWWVWHHRAAMHLFFFCEGFLGGIMFLAINIFLFARVLASDGLLGEYGRKHAAINRDEQQTAKSDTKVHSS